MSHAFYSVNSITLSSSFNRRISNSLTPTNLQTCLSCTETSSSSSYTPVICRISTRGRSGGSGSLTLEKPKLDLSQKPISESTPEIAIGGGGGDIGKKIIHGGGGGDGGNGGGDDDDFFEDFEEDDGDDHKFFRKLVLQEVFDRKFVDAVLQEWHKTAMDLPVGFRQAYEMGLVSSAQMVKFLVVHARPTLARFVSRVLPDGLSRGFNGRMVADPGFLYKFILEQMSTIGCNMFLELNNRKGRIKKEWDLALVNVLTMSLCNGVVMWSLAPCRSYGTTFRYGFENILQKLPNNAFEKSYLLREFNMYKRIQSFFYRAAQLGMVGVVSGGVQFYLSKVSRYRRGEKLVDQPPCVRTCCLVYGAFIGVYANTRYQLLCGADRALTDYLNDVRIGLFINTALRVLNVHVGEMSRTAWLGPEPGYLSTGSIISSINNIFKGNYNGNDGTRMPRARRKMVVKRRVAMEQMAPC